MPYRFVRWIFAALLVGGLAGASHAQDSGVLLGLRHDESIEQPLPYYAGDADSLSRPVYRTLLITEGDGAFAILPVANDLLIPRADGYWRVGTKRSVYNNWVEDFAWAAPEGTRPDLAGIQPFNGEYCEGHRTQAILYAGPRYLSLDQRSAGYCEGGVHPWFFNTLAVVPLDSTLHPGLRITEILGAAAYEALEDGTGAFLESLENAAVRAGYLEEPDDANWGLVRRQGQWTAIGRMEPSEETSRGLYTDLPLAFAVPPALTGEAAPPVAWRTVTAFAPNAVDAFVAPDGDWLILLRPNRLSIHRVDDGVIGPAIMTQPTPPGTLAVATRWATPARLRAWAQHFERLAQSPGPPP